MCYYTDLFLSPFSGGLYNGGQSITILETDYDGNGSVFPDCCPDDKPQDSCTGPNYPGLDPQNSKFKAKFLSFENNPTCTKICFSVLPLV